MSSLLGASYCLLGPLHLQSHTFYFLSKTLISNILVILSLRPKASRLNIFSNILIPMAVRVIFYVNLFGGILENFLNSEDYRPHLWL